MLTSILTGPVTFKADFSLPVPEFQSLQAVQKRQHHQQSIMVESASGRLLVLPNRL